MDTRRGWVNFPFFHFERFCRGSSHRLHKTDIIFLLLNCVSLFVAVARSGELEQSAYFTFQNLAFAFTWHEQNLTKAVNPSSYMLIESELRFWRHTHYWEYRLTWTSKDMIGLSSCWARKVRNYLLKVISYSSSWLRRNSQWRTGRWAYPLLNATKKQGQIHGKTVVDGWAGAVLQKPLTTSKR